jgi:hypothetical protein
MYTVDDHWKPTNVMASMVDDAYSTVSSLRDCRTERNKVKSDWSW